MAKAKFPKIPDWAIGLIVTAAVAGLFYARLDFLAVLDAKLFDLRMKILTSGPPDDRIAIIAIDDDSIAKLGRWPWPRSRIAAAVDLLSKKGARVIGLTLLFSEPEESSGLVAVQALETEFLALNLGPAGAPFLDKIQQLKADMGSDQKLAAALREAGSVILPLGFALNPRPGQARAAAAGVAVPPEVEKSAFRSVEAETPEAARPFVADRALWPLPPLMAAAAALGHTNKVPDPDGVARHEILAVEYAGKFYPSFALAAAARFLGMPADKIGLVLGEGVDTPAGRIPADANVRMLVNYYGRDGTLPRYSF